LIVALLAFHPIRSKNFAALTLSCSFRRDGERWSIVLGSRDTKSGRPEERQVSHELNRAIARYLTWARPILAGRGEFMIGQEEAGQENSCLTGALWIGQTGEPLTQGAVELAIARTTETTLGIALRPHDLRRCAAVTAAYNAGGMPHLASALLQHRDRRVTDAHYNRASSAQAGERFGQIVAGMRT
jgi:integrase